MKYLKNGGHIVICEIYDDESPVGYGEVIRITTQSEGVLFEHLYRNKIVRSQFIKLTEIFDTLPRIALALEHLVGKNEAGS